MSVRTLATEAINDVSLTLTVQRASGVKKYVLGFRVLQPSFTTERRPAGKVKFLNGMSVVYPQKVQPG